MISGKDIYNVLAAIVPLYVAMILGYGSVRWWKIFTPDQCSGINRFVSVFAVPMLSFRFISGNDPYTMNFRFLAGDSLQKVVVLVALFLWNTCTKYGSLDWSITFFSLSTLPNTLVVGVPMLSAMYGDFSASLMAQIVVLQCVVWYTIILAFFEYRGAKLLISEQFPGTAGSITSLGVDSDVVSLSGREPLQADAETGEDGKLHVVVKRSASSSMVSSFNRSPLTSMAPRASNFTGVEIYSVHSSREPTPGASFNQKDICATFGSKLAVAPSPKLGRTTSWQSAAGFGDVSLLQPSKGATPRTTNFEEEVIKMHKKRGWRSKSAKLFNNGLVSSYPPTNPLFSDSTSGVQRKKHSSDGGGGAPNKELHMFVWSSIAASSPASEGNLRHAVNGAASTDFGTIIGPSKAVDVPHETVASKAVHQLIENMNSGGKVSGDVELEIEEGTKYPTCGSPYTCQKKVDIGKGDANKKQGKPPTIVITRLIFIMVWRKLIRNPNTYASVLGLVWSLISYRWHVKLPSIIDSSITILSNTGIGLAMFSLGFFMALQPKIIACGKTMAAYSMAVRFLVGPGVVAATSAAMGIRGVLLQVAIVQAALPQSVVPFVFAKEYNLHADILCTAVIFGMVLAFPVSILYYVLMGL